LKNISLRIICSVTYVGDYSTAKYSVFQRLNEVYPSTGSALRFVRQELTSRGLSGCSEVTLAIAVQVYRMIEEAGRESFDKKSE